LGKDLGISSGKDVIYFDLKNKLSRHSKGRCARPYILLGDGVINFLR
jgi:hypothetical protein